LTFPVLIGDGGRFSRNGTIALVKGIPMAKRKKQPREPEPLFKVGDRVSFPFGSGEVSGIVVEDRGCLGIGGRRLYGIRIEFSPGDSRYTEMPEVELTAVAQPS